MNDSTPDKGAPDTRSPDTGTPDRSIQNQEAPNRAGAAVAGFFAGGIAGFMLTEAFAAFSHFVLDVTLSAEDTPALVAVHVGVPLLAALAGALICYRLASRRGR
ncbi:hypothetical protein [Actinomadura sp. 9N407]|uniref:hypothetical protein n=1 Tax=Actinomadura sp. 9N407 TaxID=3375154 RepID=UPI0037987009